MAIVFLIDHSFGGVYLFLIKELNMELRKAVSEQGQF